MPSISTCTQGIFFCKIRQKNISLNFIGFLPTGYLPSSPFLHLKQRQESSSLQSISFIISFLSTQMPQHLYWFCHSSIYRSLGHVMQEVKICRQYSNYYVFILFHLPLLAIVEKWIFFQPPMIFIWQPGGEARRRGQVRLRMFNYCE